MIRRLTPVLLVTLMASPAGAAELPAFGICYNPRVKAAELKRFDLLVLDSSHPADEVRALRGPGKVVLGYLSLGAVDAVRPWYDSLEKAGLLKGRNPGFTSRVIDVTGPRWKELLLAEAAPAVLKGGFDGLFLDDLDLLQATGQKAQGVALMRALREKFPRPKLMANRGLEYLPDFAASVDYGLLESCVTLKGALRPPGDLAWALGHLKRGLAVNPRLVGCAIDYADDRKLTAADYKALVAAARKAHAGAGLASCVTRDDLQVVPAP